MLTNPESTGTSTPAMFSELAPHLAALDGFLQSQTAQFEPEIHDLAGYCLESSGKRIRPSLVFFSGWSTAEVVNESLVRVAAIIEMVHLATLVHDDVMDRAEVRRKKPTAAHRFGVERAVLLGDAMFAHALTLAASFPTTEVCLRVATSTRLVCSGEIMQTLASQPHARAIKEYRRIIDLKTAELFSVSCLLGAKLGTSDADYAEAAARFGRHLGIAYQMYDDLADYFGNENEIGKTLGTDLGSKKATLPLILLLDRLPTAERAAARREIEMGDTSQLVRRVEQMNDLGVFRDVASEITSEIQTGLRTLEPHHRRPGISKLRELAAMLDARVGALRP